MLRSNTSMINNSTGSAEKCLRMIKVSGMPKPFLLLCRKGS